LIGVQVRQKTVIPILDQLLQRRSSVKKVRDELNAVHRAVHLNFSRKI
jgi:hypothetical protein